MSRFWSSSRADGGLSFAFHLFSSLSTRRGSFCSSPMICCKSSWAQRRKEGGKKEKTNARKVQHRPGFLQINSLSACTPPTVLSLLPKVFIFFFFLPEQIRKDAVCEVLLRQAWHVAIHSSLMWQGPFTAKPVLLLRRLLIMWIKQAGGDPPPTKRDLSDTVPPGNFGSPRSCKIFSPRPRFRSG